MAVYVNGEIKTLTTEEEYNLLHDVQMEQYNNTTTICNANDLLTVMLEQMSITAPDGTECHIGDSITLPFTLGKSWQLQYADGAFSYVAVDDANALGGKNNPFLADSTKLTDLPLVDGAYYKFSDGVKKYTGSKFVASLT